MINPPPLQIPISSPQGGITPAWASWFSQLRTLFAGVEDTDAARSPDAYVALASVTAALATALQELQTQPPTPTTELYALENELRTQPRAPTAELDAGLRAVEQSLATQTRNELGTFAALQQDNLPWVRFANFPSPEPPTDPGVVRWSDDDATLDLYLYGGVTYQFGQQLDFHPKNTSGVQINKGMAVMATGVVGASTKIECARAVADGTVAAQYMLGIATQNIPNNDFGYVAWFGSIRGLNTTGANKTVPEVWADGDILYFDPAYPGELTKNQPAAPNLDLPIAIITNAANNGAIFVRMKTGETMNELHDVSAASPNSGDVLIYDAVQTRWEAAAVTAGTNIAVTPSAGGLTIATTAAITADLTNNTGNLIDSSVGLTNGAGASAGTLTNAPAAGNPTKWVPIDDNGTTRYIPAW